MAEENTPAEVPEGKSLKEMIGGMFNNCKTPVFWFAAGYVLCKYMDRKRKLF